MRYFGFAAIFALGWRLAVAASAQDVRTNDPAVEITLKEQLETALRARRPVEFRFIDKIVAQVDSGDLPRDVVQSSFNWARKKPSKRIQYFEQALRLRAKRKGIKLNTNGVTTLR